MENSKLINQVFLKEYEKIQIKYPEFVKRIENRANWIAILLDKSITFLKLLGLEGEFKSRLNDNELFVYNSMKKIKEEVNK